jgi:hypothetical protein
MHRRLIPVLFAALLSAAACAGNQAEDGSELSEARGVALVVRNENFADVTVYAVRDGTRARVGWVPGNSTARFTVSGALIPTGELNLVAFPLASTGAAASGRVLVREGQTVEFTISPQLAGSYATAQ